MILTRETLEVLQALTPIDRVRRASLVNHVADVCVKAAEYRAAELEYVLVAEHDDYNEDAVAEARRTLHKAAHGVDESLTALEEARRGQA